MASMEHSRQPAEDENNLLEHVIGRIRDVDSHEMTPAAFWSEEFGEVTEPLARFFLDNPPNAFCGGEDADRLSVRTEAIDEYWTRGVNAPSARNMEARLNFMDSTGIAQALVFGSGPALVGLTLISAPRETLELTFGGRIAFDPVEQGHRIIEAHNDWCLRIGRISQRLRPVPIVLTEHSLEAAIGQSRRLIDQGAKAISISAATPIEGKAPSHPDNDAFWQLLADADIPVMMHLGGDQIGFLKAGMAWMNAPSMTARTNTVPKEVDGHPYQLSTVGFGAANYVANLVLGGTLERVPTLRIGIAELNGGWIGPTSEQMDLWAQMMPTRLKGVISLKPSAYVQRNVRVAPFNFEPVDTYIERHPFLADVYCFSTDFPHIEGGPDPRRIWIDRLGKFGAEMIEKVFVTNAELIMPSDRSAVPF